MAFTLRKKRVTPEIDVTSFSDIAFLLIIFFILTTSITYLAGSKMEIPSGSTAPGQKEKQQQMTVNLKGAQIEIGEGKGKSKSSRQVSLDRLKAELRDQRFPEKKEEERFVIVDSAEDVPYGHYFQVVMAITDAGGVLALLEHEEEGGNQ